MTERTNDAWLKAENAELYWMVRAMAGDDGALLRLESEGRGLALFTRVLTGDRKALSALEEGPDLELDYVHGLAVNCQQSGWLQEHHPVLHAVFEAVKGDEGPLRRLKKKKPGLTKLARLVRDAREKAPKLTAASPADVGCLVAEVHLSKGEYHKAIEAFTRAIETAATPDAYEGRARAYRALAEADERRAAEHKGATDG
jgi:hypothetical protein